MKSHYLWALLAVSVTLNLVGAFATYKAVRYRQVLSHYQEWLQTAERKAREVESSMLAGNPYRDENALLGQRVRQGEAPEVIFYGASITRGWDLSSSFPGERFVNRGMGGKILPYLVLHFRENVIDLHPRFVTIKACAINMTPELPAESVQQSFMNLCDLARANGIAPIAATMLPAREEAESFFPGYSVSGSIRRFNEWVLTYARERSIPVVDYYRVLADERGFLPPGLSRDDLHPNVEGYRRMAGEFQSVWKEISDKSANGTSERKGSS